MALDVALAYDRLKTEMPASYSYDLRTKVISAIDEGMRKTQASRVFKISRNTINLWLKKTRVAKVTGVFSKSSVGLEE